MTTLEFIKTTNPDLSVLSEFYSDSSEKIGDNARGIAQNYNNLEALQRVCLTEKEPLDVLGVNMEAQLILHTSLPSLLIRCRTLKVSIMNMNFDYSLCMMGTYINNNFLRSLEL